MARLSPCGTAYLLAVGLRGTAYLLAVVLRGTAYLLAVVLRGTALLAVFAAFTANKAVPRKTVIP